MAHVVILMGSKSDEEKVSPCVDVLKSLGIHVSCEAKYESNRLYHK